MRGRVMRDRPSLMFLHCMSDFAGSHWIRAHEERYLIIKFPVLKIKFDI